ncbi:MAG: heme exporter protein CcmB [Deltaproteobacteria bacterium]|nr:heme exporter protein CcmB [Deltaproteobacteria bacterium]
MSTTKMGALVPQILGILRKDLALDWYGRGRVLAVFAFAATSLLLFSFAVGPNTQKLAAHAGGYLWLSLLFASVLALSGSLREETEEEALESLMLLPVDPRALFFGKALANSVMLWGLAAILVPLSFALYHTHVTGSWIHLILALLLGCGGLAAPGTLYATMTARARGRDVLLPLLLFPLVVPVLVAAVNVTQLCFAGDPMQQTNSWLSLLAVFNLVYWGICPLLYGRVIEA